jgi:hypothetical protein
MDYINYREQSQELKGKSVRCIKMNDEYPVPSGTIGTIHVKWDNGSMLGLVPNEDIYEILNY